MHAHGSPHPGSVGAGGSAVELVELVELDDVAVAPPVSSSGLGPDPSTVEAQAARETDSSTTVSRVFVIGSRREHWPCRHNRRLFRELGRGVMRRSRCTTPRCSRGLAYSQARD
jgi:hypothetical protein